MYFHTHTHNTHAHPHMRANTCKSRKGVYRFMYLSDFKYIKNTEILTCYIVSTQERPTFLILRTNPRSHVSFFPFCDMSWAAQIPFYFVNTLVLL